MGFLILRQAIILLGTGAGAITDARTGMIPDKITLTMIAIGILLNIAELKIELFAVGAIVFAIGYLAYWAGKIGGGDVKLFTGIALLIPFSGKGIFILDVLMAAALTSIVFYGALYSIKYARKGIEWKEIKTGVGRAGLIGAFITLYFFMIYSYKLMSLEGISVLGIAVFFALVFLALEKGIRKEFFLKKVKLGNLEEDEVVAQDFLDEKVKKILGLKFKGVIGQKELIALKKEGVKEISVYQNLPPFAPFIFIGIVIAIAVPGLMEKILFV